MLRRRRPKGTVRSAADLGLSSFSEPRNVRQRKCKKMNIRGGVDCKRGKNLSVGGGEHGNPSCEKKISREGRGTHWEQIGKKVDTRNNG